MMSTKDNLKMTLDMGMGNIIMLTEIYTLASGLLVSKKEKECLFKLSKGTDTQEIGSRMQFTDGVFKIGMMDKHMKVSLLKTKKMDLVDGLLAII